MKTQPIEGAEVTLWLDPVCPFSWNTARWLAGVARQYGFDIDWRIMSLAILNEGREVPPAQKARMHDSRRIGRLMTAVRDELGIDGFAAAYFAFGEEYFDHSADLDDQLAERILAAAKAHRTTTAALSDATLDSAVQQSHQASQDLLGEETGSPVIGIDGQYFFGPVLTSVPATERGRAVFDAIATLAATPEFSQLQRPRAHA